MDPSFRWWMVSRFNQYLLCILHYCSCNAFGWDTFPLSSKGVVHLCLAQRYGTEVPPSTKLIILTLNAIIRCHRNLNNDFDSWSTPEGASLHTTELQNCLAFDPRGSFESLVGRAGLEPATYALSGRRSTY